MCFADSVVDDETGKSVCVHSVLALFTSCAILHNRFRPFDAQQSVRIGANRFRSAREGVSSGVLVIPYQVRLFEDDCLIKCGHIFVILFCEHFSESSDIT